MLVLAAVGLAAPAAASAAIGYRDQPYTATSVIKPSGYKPQSKLWYAYGAWWGDLFDQASGAYHVFRLDPATQRWVDTGTTLDDRNSSHADVLWDGSHLYVASARDESQPTGDVELLRYSFDTAAGRWVSDGPPSTEAPSSDPRPIEAVVLDKDSTGQIWLTYTMDNSDGTTRTVYVAHTSGAPGQALTPFALPVAEADNLSAPGTPDSTDDISALVSFGGAIGVMWSHQADQKVYFAVHPDGAPDSAWTRETALSEPFAADDHINLKSVQSSSGRQVFAAVKTSDSDHALGTSAPQVYLLQRDAAGAWSKHLFGTVGDDHTRPIVLTDEQTRRLYLFATSPTVETAGRQTIYYKSTSLDAPSFAGGLGTPFIQSDSDDVDVNDATSTKQDLGPLPFGLVLASDAGNYWHNALALGHGTTGTPTPTPTPTPAPGGTSRPKLTRLSIKPSAFRSTQHRVRPARRLGTLIRYRLDRAATVRMTVQRRTTGRRVGGRCVAVTRANRGHRACTRYVGVSGHLTHKGRAGANHQTFNGRLRRRALRPARYRLVAVARAGGRSSTSHHIAFRILRRAAS